MKKLAEGDETSIHRVMEDLQKIGGIVLNKDNIRYSQTCIKRTLLGQRKNRFFKTGDLLKEVEFIYMNFVLKDTKRWPFITGDCLIEVNTWVSLTVSWWNYIGCRPYLAKTFKWQYHTWIFMHCFDTQEIIICYSKNYNNLLKKTFGMVRFMHVLTRYGRQSVCFLPCFLEILIVWR